MDKEIWRPVKGYEGYYEVSNLGRVKRLERTQFYPDGHTQVLNEYISNGVPTTAGYLQASLTKDGKRIRRHIHDLVAEAFIPNPNNLEEVNHIDYNKKNNYVCNLEWCTHTYNVQDMIKHYNKQASKKYCIECGKELSDNRAIRCRFCASKNSSKVKDKPNRETLKQLIRTLSFVQIGLKYHVTDNAIRKWCNAENLPKKKIDINKFTDEEWEKI